LVVQTVADFDGDGKDDIRWFNGKAGETAIWLMNGMSVKATAVSSRTAVRGIPHVRATSTATARPT
jgi:hypothetical protein